MTIFLSKHYVDEEHEEFEYENNIRLYEDNEVCDDTLFEWETYVILLNILCNILLELIYFTLCKYIVLIYLLFYVHLSKYTNMTLRPKDKGKGMTLVSRIKGSICLYRLHENLCDNQK